LSTQSSRRLTGMRGGVTGGKRPGTSPVAQQMGRCRTICPGQRVEVNGSSAPGFRRDTADQRRRTCGAFDGSFVGALTDEIKGEVADHGDVLGPMSGVQAGLILIESDVEGPVQVVFDGPMASYGLREVCSRQHAGGDVGSPLSLDFVAALDATFDHGDGGETNMIGFPRRYTTQPLKSDQLWHPRTISPMSRRSSPR
jgi:hypothetical protein